MNVIICLRDIAENPVTRDGKKTTPVSFESNCLEEVCGSCAMLINGKVRMACSALVDKLEQPIRLELTDSESAAVFRTDDGYTYIVMPLSRDR